MKVRQSFVLSVNPENGLRRVRDIVVSVPNRPLKAQEISAQPKPQPKAFGTIVVHAKNTDEVVITSSRRESTSVGRLESQRCRHAHRRYWNSN